MDVIPISIDASSATHAGKVRERNEDSCLVRTDVGLWAVADGMGGHEAGDLASRALVESLNAIGKPEAALDLVEQCEAQIFHANQRIMELSRAHNGATIGTTAAVLLVRDEHYACVWAGDSRIYLIKSGAIEQLSQLKRQRLDQAFDEDVRLCATQETLDPDWVIEARKAYASAIDAYAKTQAAVGR